MVDTNTLNVFVKHKSARLGLLSILARRGATVFTPSSPFSMHRSIRAGAGSNPQKVISFLDELLRLSRSAGLVLTLVREFTLLPINQLLSSHILAIILKN
ncbi:hypothetical protein [uncultured Desulfovibrio sp.]|uniref:hypothetical protein n=1 Tax=uncultured Desulfovibrio sp. TaxID=167968 RepID=UPI0025976BF1|nr:hypothetical protein [uncultured Desulfovibrio sp.]